MSALIRVHTVLRLAGLSRSRRLLTATFHRSSSSGFAICLLNRGHSSHLRECIGVVSVVSAEAVARRSRVIASLASVAACYLFRAVRRFTCLRRASRITLMRTATVHLQSFREPSWRALRCVRWPTCERCLPRQRDSGYRRHMNQSPNHALQRTRRGRFCFQPCVFSAGSLSLGR
jgi:hypothetical protein